MTRTMRYLLSAMFISTGVTFGTAHVAVAQDAKTPLVTADFEKLTAALEPAPKKEAAKRTDKVQKTDRKIEIRVNKRHAKPIQRTRVRATTMKRATPAKKVGAVRDILLKHAGHMAPPGLGPAPHLANGNALKAFSDIASDIFSSNEFELACKMLSDSDIATELMSGNELELACKMFSDLAAQLFSGNHAELFSGNEAELLSGNQASLLSGNEAELFSGNQFSLFSNLHLEIHIENSGNNSGNHDSPSGTAAGHTSSASVKEFAALDRDHDGLVSLAEFQMSKKTEKKARRAKKRFAELDRDASGGVTDTEFASVDEKKADK